VAPGGNSEGDSSAVNVAVDAGDTVISDVVDLEANAGVVAAATAIGKFVVSASGIFPVSTFGTILSFIRCLRGTGMVMDTLKGGGSKP
jgi:hypothetical protein